MGKTLKELRARAQEIQVELREINSGAEAAGRTALTADEEKRFRALEEEYESVKRNLRVAAMSEDIDEADLRAIGNYAREFRVTTERAKAGAAFRQLLTAGTKGSAALELRAASMVAAADIAGVIPVTVGDLVEPLEKGLILGLLGIKMPTGLSGDYKYPLIPYVEASIAGRDASLSDTSFDIQALTPNPQRVGITIPLSNWALTQSDNVLYNEVVKALSQSIARLLNRWMFQPQAVVSGVCGAMAYDAEKNPIKQVPLSAVPTYKELMSMPGAVESTGAYNDGTFAFVMSARMAAILRATPAGNGDKMIISDDNKLGGYPVYLTEEIESKGDKTYNSAPLHVGFGRWSDAQVGQFGGMRLTVDPYTRAKDDVTVLTLNADFSEDVIRKGSFVIGTIAQ